MYDNIKARIAKEHIEVGGIYWHPGYAQLVRVTSLGMRYEGVAADFEFLDGEMMECREPWCFADVLHSQDRVQAETLELLASFQANQLARKAFAKLEG